MTKETLKVVRLLVDGTVSSRVASERGLFKQTASCDLNIVVVVVVPESGLFGEPMAWRCTSADKLLLLMSIFVYKSFTCSRSLARSLFTVCPLPYTLLVDDDEEEEEASV